MSTASPHPAHEHALRHVARLSAGPPIDSRLRGHRQRSPGPLDRDGLLVMQALARDRGLPQPVRCRNQQPRAAAHRRRPRSGRRGSGTRRPRCADRARPAGRHPDRPTSSRSWPSATAGGGRRTPASVSSRPSASSSSSPADDLSHRSVLEPDTAADGLERVVAGDGP